MFGSHRLRLGLLFAALYVFAPRAAQAQATPEQAALDQAASDTNAPLPAAPATQLRLASPAEPAPRHGPWRLQPGLLPAGIALFPGFLLHGAGAFSIGDRSTARRLALSEAVGLTAFLGGGTLLALTGTSRQLVGVLAPVTAFGFGLFALSFLADLYAASTGGREARAPDFLPKFDVQAGYAYVYDPQFAFRSFLTLAADFCTHALRASPQAWLSFDDNNQRFQLDLAYRALGRSEHRSARDGSYLELATALRYHRFQSDDFAVLTPSMYLDARLDLARVGDSLRGSFVEGQLGAGLEFYDFRIKSSSLGDNAFSLLITRFGFGMYFGDGGAKSGEAAVYYDHRRDGFAAGLGVSGIPVGILGHFGLRGHYFITRSLGLSGLLEVGSALVTGIAVRYRHLPARGGAR